MSKIVLLSDVGGTNARFELRRMGADTDELLATETYPTVTPDAAPGSGSGTSTLHVLHSDKSVDGVGWFASVAVLIGLHRC
jgi:glucokinase